MGMQALVSPLTQSTCVPFSQAVYDELVSMVDGGETPELKKGRPNVVMFVGLQGEVIGITWVVVLRVLLPPYHINPCLSFSLSPL